MQNDLIAQLAFLQLVLPILAMALNVALPVAGKVGVLLRAVALFGMLFYAALAGIWLFPPWWTPFLLSLVQAVISLWQFRRVCRRQQTRTIWRVGEAILAGLAIFGATFLTLPAVQGRALQEAAIDLDMPLGRGRYLVISGGAASQINSHVLTLDLPRAANFRGQSYGVDIIGINSAGFRTSGISPSNPRLYEIYGASVLAPCDGTVLVAIDGVPDNRVPLMNRESMTGNSVVLECDGLAVVLAHFIPGSLTVTEGHAVMAGQKIAEVGNSGNSGEPHLHIHVQTIAPTDAPISGEPLLFTVEGEFLLRNKRFTVED